MEVPLYKYTLVILTGWYERATVKCAMSMKPAALNMNSPHYVPSC